MMDAVSQAAAELELWLDRKGIALTMGGEPTFVPQSPEGPEWSTAALGPQKLAYARRFSAHLIEHVYPGAFAMQVFGKWYPGEALPRWNWLTLHARDGSPLWPDTGRLFLDNSKGGLKPATATRFAHALAAELDLCEFLQPAFEQGDAADAAPSRWVLPLDASDHKWVSERWQFAETGRLELFLGDSPVGLRIPLYQLPDKALKRALSVEILEGALAVFLPPLQWDDFRRLLACIHQVVRRGRFRQLLFCGYGPEAAGSAVINYGLAADPGVLEVNLPPCRTWQEYHRSLSTAFAAAEAVGMRAVKRQLNGAIHGTGGGAHLAFGGPDLASNPFLQSPARIASLLRYWQHHPVLSYGFTGQYVGPGSQAPRVDEGPSHGLYELEVACEGIARLGADGDGKAIDQALRNLLTDSAGNTHRAEICMDKFANPLTANGKLGIIELRAFEMLPSADWMASVALLIRTVIARLCKAPFNEALYRWGPRLHDRFFLPAFLWQDLRAICSDLRQQGFHFDEQWLRPAFEFRFPLLGTLQLPDGVRLEVRQALESWPLMAEESRGTATVRVVDNSTDRLQLELSDGSALDHGELIVNGMRLPFSEIDGHWICGLRYKCASAYPALHPHVPIQSPLLFQWQDSSSQSVAAAAWYHYWNPYATIYDAPPANLAEAAQRRHERWQLIAHPVARDAPARQPDTAPEFAHTIDLRR